MSRLLYEKSITYKGHLIIPFVFKVVNNEAIYSYKLLSELGYKGELHSLENPASIYSVSSKGIIDIAKEHLNENSDITTSTGYFNCRYTYKSNLIIIHEVLGQYFYDHYKAEDLNNIAAPKLFKSEQECINWIKQGLDRSYIAKPQ